jgi:hypothetical protein
MDEQPRQIITVTHYGVKQNTTTKWNLSVPADLAQEYINVQKCKNLFDPSHEELLRLLKKNGGYYSGQNAFTACDAYGGKVEFDYTDTGTLIEQRWWDKNGLTSRDIEPDETGTCLTHHELADKNTLNVIFSELKKAGRSGLIKNMQISLKKGLKVLEINGANVRGSEEARLLGHDIMSLMENKSEISNKNPELVNILLPICETIELVRKPKVPQTV